jgi:teichoic acid transport system permease protein
MAALWARREFAWYMAMGNLKARNASTALGLFWWVLNPLLLGAVYFIVFGIVLGVSRDLSYLLSGMFVFYYTSTALTGGANSIISNSRLLVNLSFPRLIMPIVAITEAGVGFLASIPALYLIIGPSQGDWPGIEMFWLFPVIFVIHTVFNLGLAAITARIAVPFRDINNLLPYVNRIWLYLSPIIIPASFVTDLTSPWDTLFNLNPLVPIIGLYRTALLGYAFESWMLTAALAWAVGLAVVAVAAFVKYEGRMARYL